MSRIRLYFFHNDVMDTLLFEFAFEIRMEKSGEDLKTACHLKFCFKSTESRRCRELEFTSETSECDLILFERGSKQI